MQPPPYGYRPPPNQPPQFGPPPYGQGGYPPGYPPYPPQYGYGYPSRPSGVHPMVWVGLALGLLIVFGLAGVFAIGVAKGMSRASAAPTTYTPYSGGGYGSSPATADTDDDDDNDPKATGTAPLPVPHRNVPVHDLKVLDGCSSADLKMVENGIGDAVDVGAPAYNRGDFNGCYQTYDKAAKDIEAKLPKACKGPTKALEDGRSKAKLLSISSDQAWAMRDSFDGLLDVIDRKGEDL